jgi:hypothetical protein
MDAHSSRQFYLSACFAPSRDLVFSRFTATTARCLPNNSLDELGGGWAWAFSFTFCGSLKIRPPENGLDEMCGGWAALPDLNPNETASPFTQNLRRMLEGEFLMSLPFVALCEVGRVAP